MKLFLEKHRNRIYVLLGIALVILMWEIISYTTNANFFPEFFVTLSHALILLSDRLTLVSLGWTFLRLILSFLISAVLGTALGILAGYYPRLKYLLSPLITVLRALPTIAVAMVLIVYVPNFSLYITSMVMTPIIYQASLEGSEKNYHQYEYVLLLKGRNHFSNITHIIFPLSLNYILLGFLQALGLGMKVEVMSETLAYKSTFYGIGKMITQAYNNSEFFQLMSLVLLLLILSLILECLIATMKRWTEKKVGLQRKSS